MTLLAELRRFLKLSNAEVRLGADDSLHVYQTLPVHDGREQHLILPFTDVLPLKEYLWGLLVNYPDAHREAVTLGDAPPTEPGWYWYEKGEEKCVTWVEELRPDLDDVSILYAHFGGFMYRLGDPQLDGARWSGRIPEPTSSHEPDEPVLVGSAEDPIAISRANWERAERIEDALVAVRQNVELPDPIHEMVRQALEET